MEETAPIKSTTMRFLSFADDKEDAEKEAKLKDAAARIEQAIARERNLSELVDYKEPEASEMEQQVDPANDTRSLYERLREQKDKKKDDLEESKKLSNMITKLDEEDVDYLNEVARNKREQDLRKRLEVQDALEAKRILDEQKMIEQERKIKESLLGKSATSSYKSPMNRLIMSSRIKVKPKVKDQDGAANLARKTSVETAQDSKGSQQMLSGPNSGSGSQKHQDTKRETSEMSKDTGGGNDGAGGQRDVAMNQRPSDAHQDCTCTKDVMTSIGVLASLPIVKHFRDSSDESDYSDDDLDRRLVPRSCKRRK